MELINTIDKTYADTQPSSFRAHLGASVLGKPCARQVWYIFRWAHDVKHTGRMLRLFQRGDDEEIRFISILSKVKVLVENEDVHTHKQFSFSDFNGHFGGSIDGQVLYDGPPRAEIDLPVGKGLAEFKTHNTRSFDNLVKVGLISAKLEHYVQLQVYMHYFGLQWALYMAVNKNDDRLYGLVVPYAEETALYYIDRAKAIIEQQTPPKKINESGSWWQCRFCDFKRQCHEGVQLDKNCRSCVHASAVEDSKWYCDLHRDHIPGAFIPEGCDHWTPIA